MGPYLVYIDQISKKLEGEGYAIEKNVSSDGYQYKVVASKSAFEPLMLGVMDRFFIISTLDKVDAVKLQDYSSQATKYALANRGSAIPRGFGAALLSIPVLVSDDFSEDLKVWVTKHFMEKHWAAGEFPVLVSLKERKIYYCKKLRFVGSAADGSIRRFIERELGFH